MMKEGKKEGGAEKYGAVARGTGGGRGLLEPDVAQSMT